ncbi:MAG TPA: UDP-N-acetylglucosamine 2-epimerase (non-hydrolyzing) [Thermomonas sp.]|nr:UDP-N-acetylglucosamine 2-epimerase (non-hydrolyzing) [Thermomonas sp.]
MTSATTAGRARALVLVGTRPEAIKLASLVESLRDQPGLATTFVSSGQHPRMVASTLEHLGLAADMALTPVAAGSSLSRSVRHLRDHCRDAAIGWGADAIVVQGDTATAYAGALAGHAAGIPVAHVEAGLRTQTPLRPFPEEPFRRRIATLASWHFAPTPTAAGHLLAEGIPDDAVHVVGNTVIDILRRTLQAAPAPLAGGDHLVLTLHRRENYGQGMDHVCSAVLALLARHPGLRLISPLHPNPLVGAKMRRLLGGHPRVELLPPLDYKPFIQLIATARLVITDSGGIQEEAPYLGVPVLVVRDATERPEALAYGGLRLVPPMRDAVLASAEAALAATRPAPVPFDASAPFGDGRSGARIANTLASALLRHPPLRQAVR